MEFTNLPSGISQAIANKIAQVINVFETGSRDGAYDAISIYADYTYKGNRYKQITYGKSQTTEFGNLKSLLEQYVQVGGLFAGDIQPYVSKMGKIKNGLPDSFHADTTLKAALRKAGREDGIMQKTQDKFFERYYFQPALGWFNQYQFTLPLSLLVIYDSFIHSGSILDFLRQRFAAMPPSYGGNEKEWIKQYVDARHNWLLNHSNSVLRQTVYRTNTFKKLITDNNWKLDAPFRTQGTQF